MTNLDWVKETPDRLINKGDPNTVTQCPECGTCYRLGMRYEKPVKSWLRIVLENWWTYGWRTDMQLGGTIPIGYGISWFHDNSLTAAVHPIPANVVMRTLRDFGYWMMRGGPFQFPSVKDKIDHEIGKRWQALTVIIEVPTPEDYFEQQYGVSPEEAWANKVMIGPVDMCNFVREYTALTRRERA